ncbi:MAG: hypothetical protein JJ892_10035 [Balneola sp.]|nr:hypothetical protein [Balneola sp.]MBO6711278.1 hypothetical protein [Balneola sp.]MBO6800607.1 hypothetical protein [Balneola sp.]MBO6869213.1 hypothetical protein [Balneola sp.]
MKVSIVLTTGVLISFLFTRQTVCQDTTGVYIVPGASFDFVLLPSYIEENGFEDPFEFNVNGYITVGAEIGKYFDFGQLGGYFGYGISVGPDDLEERNGGLNGEVEFDSYWNVGLNFHRILWQNKKTKNLKLELGYRASGSFHHFKGDRAFDDPNSNNDRIEEFSESIFGMEGALNLRFGSRKAERENRVIFLWEPFYFRLQNKGFGFGAQRVGLEIKL